MILSFYKLESNKAFKVMTSRNTLAPNRSAALFQRVCAFALLVFVAHGAIAGAAHNHGYVPPPVDHDNSAFSLVGTGNNDTSSNTIINGSECPVCQFHRNLLSSLTCPTLQSAPSAAPLLHQLAETVSYDSDTGLSRHGRAPPLTF